MIIAICIDLFFELMHKGQKSVVFKNPWIQLDFFIRNLIKYKLSCSRRVALSIRTKKK